MDELKSCPFCGGYARLNIWTFDGDKFRIKCVNNGCKCEAETIFYNSEAKAVEAWNTRWEKTCRNEAASSDYFVCSECSMGVDLHNDYGGFSNYTYGDWNYCPNCGAKVVG